MHELGIMTGVVDSVTEVAKANHALKVTQVNLTIGEMTEAIEEALRFAYDALTENDPLLSGSSLNLTIVKPRSRCLECGAEFEHDRFHMLCPECGGIAQLIAGRELFIENIEVDLPDDEA